MASSQRTDGGLQGVRGTKHNTASFDGIQTLPDHGYNGSSRHVLDETREEGLSLEVSVVFSTIIDRQSKCHGWNIWIRRTLLEMFWGCVNKLERDQLEATLFEPANNLADKRALDAVGLYLSCLDRLRVHFGQQSKLP